MFVMESYAALSLSDFGGSIPADTLDMITETIQLFSFNLFYFLFIWNLIKIRNFILIRRIKKNLEVWVFTGMMEAFSGGHVLTSTKNSPHSREGQSEDYYDLNAFMIIYY